ncbi:MAG: threonylcarbamoyl-AMP synthase [Prevotellaceae bacterium]|jgi:L-threonylcarbamoyladenylate synthase|nr:threonylcarbamoyl-AMP synthase [Prevotellaceae bacterium]
MSADEVEQLAAALRRGAVLLYPTDTLWGLGCDAANGAAVAKIFALKQRTDAKSLIALVGDEAMLRRHVCEVPPQASAVLRAAAGPQTIIYPEGRGFARGVCAPDGSVAIRIPRHAFCQALIRALGRPVVSTSANVAGGEAPTRLDEVPSAIRAGVDVCADPRWEGNPTRRPSGIVRVAADGAVQVIR